MLEKTLHEENSKISSLPTISKDTLDKNQKEQISPKYLIEQSETFLGNAFLKSLTLSG